MALFLAINTSGLAVLPTGMIAMRASMGSHAPGSIFITTVVSTLCAACAGIVTAKVAGRFFPYTPVAGEEAHVPMKQVDVAQAEAQIEAKKIPVTPKQRIVGWTLIIATASAFIYALYMRAEGGLQPVGWGEALKEGISTWPLVLLLVGFVLFGVVRGVKVYDCIVEGGKEGFQVALRIIPYLVAILVAVGMLRASGAVDMLVRVLDPFTSLIGMPGEALPMALLRPLTGSGAYAVAADIMKAQGPDSLAGNIVSTIMGTTETTFYVLALYLGVVAIRNGRQTVLACLAADIVGTLAAVWSCRPAHQLTGRPLAAARN